MAARKKPELMDVLFPRILSAILHNKLCTVYGARITTELTAEMIVDCPSTWAVTNFLNFSDEYGGARAEVVWGTRVGDSITMSIEMLRPVEMPKPVKPQLTKGQRLKLKSDAAAQKLVEVQQRSLNADHALGQYKRQLLVDIVACGVSWHDIERAYAEDERIKADAARALEADAEFYRHHTETYNLVPQDEIPTFLPAENR